MLLKCTQHVAVLSDCHKHSLVKPLKEALHCDWENMLQYKWSLRLKFVSLIAAEHPADYPSKWAIQRQRVWGPHRGACKIYLQHLNPEITFILGHVCLTATLDAKASFLPIFYACITLKGSARSPPRSGKLWHFWGNVRQWLRSSGDSSAHYQRMPATFSCLLSWTSNHSNDFSIRSNFLSFSTCNASVCRLRCMMRCLARMLLYWASVQARCSPFSSQLWLHFLLTRLSAKKADDEFNCWASEKTRLGMVQVIKRRCLLGVRRGIWRGSDHVGSPSMFFSWFGRS